MFCLEGSWGHTISNATVLHEQHLVSSSAGLASVCMHCTVHTEWIHVAGIWLSNYYLEDELGGCTALIYIYMRMISILDLLFLSSFLLIFLLFFSFYVSFSFVSCLGRFYL